MSSRFPLPVRIAGTSSTRPGPAVSTAELSARVTPPRSPDEVLRRTGIVHRHFAPRRATAVALGANALREALAMAALSAAALERLIFVSSTGGDQLAPANANLVAGALAIAGTCAAFDLNNACMGFLSAFDVAARSIATGCGPVGIVVVELLSRFTTPTDPRPYLVLADAAAAVVLDRGRDGDAVLASWLRNDGPAGGHIRLAHPGLTRRFETFQFAASNQRITAHAIEAIRRSVDAGLHEAGLRLSDVRWVLTHQPNGSILHAVVEALGVDPERVVRVVEEVGSIGAASIPLTLDALRRSGRVHRGDRILMVGVGAGISYGAVVLQVGAEW